MRGLRLQEPRPAVLRRWSPSIPFLSSHSCGLGVRAQGAQFAFSLHEVEDASGDRVFTLTADDIALLNPNTRTCPVFRTRRDAELAKGIYRRVPVLVREEDPRGNPWGVKFLRMFDMSNDSHLFRTVEQLEELGAELDGNVFIHGDQRWLPLYEGKMVHHYDHRYGDFSMRSAGSQDTGRRPQAPRPTSS